MSWLSLRTRSGHSVRRHGAPLALVAAALCCAALPVRWSQAQEPGIPVVSREPLTALVAGLMAYTTWPQAPQPLRLCIWGQGRGVEGLRNDALSAAAQRPVVVQQGLDVTQAPQRCDAVYVTALAPLPARSLPRALVGRPVLMIGEGPDFCADGGMFCLE